jgi:hypothetical protein
MIAAVRAVSLSKDRATCRGRSWDFTHEEFSHWMTALDHPLERKTDCCRGAPGTRDVSSAGSIAAPARHRRGTGAAPARRGAAREPAATTQRLPVARGRAGHG